MSKPVLSELEYNASDVASAILSKADLSVTNEDLGVTDQSSLFTFQSGWAETNKFCYSFNGFMFVCLTCKHSDSDPGNPETFCVISDSDYYPIETMFAPTVSYQGDTAQYVILGSDGDIKVQHFLNQSHSSYYMAVNCWYRYA
mgnify:CR=1 FL=1|tara:strand:+ start:128 stop:556 length:429 start_codon:yes stop_codon:yes gene_type:complete